MENAKLMLDEIMSHEKLPMSPSSASDNTRGGGDQDKLSIHSEKNENNKSHLSVTKVTAHAYLTIAKFFAKRIFQNLFILIF